MVFPMEDDYAFGVLQSGLHAAWLAARGSTLKDDRRYTSSTVFASFPWPQAPGAAEVAAVARAAVALRAVRGELQAARGCGLGALSAAAAAPLAEAHAALDAAVRVAYGMDAGADALSFLRDLNQACAAREAEGGVVVGPGLPPGVAAEGLITTDALAAPELG
jgi:hypothetical protein